MLSTGGLTAPGVISTQDTIGLVFEFITDKDENGDPLVIPPPKPNSVAQFTGPQVEIVDSTTGTFNLNVEVVGDTDYPITLSLEEAGANLCGVAGDGDIVLKPATDPTPCLPNVYDAIASAGLGTEHRTVKRARSVVGTSYNRFDWDYKFKNTAFNLIGLNPTKTIEIKFSTDIRLETNRLFVIKLIRASSNVDLGPNILKYFVIKKISNPQPAFLEVTYSSLLASKGPITLNCIGCHNSRDLQGGYDVTDYQLITTPTEDKPMPVVNLNDAINYATWLADTDPNKAPFRALSKMYKRINADDPDNANLTPMPVDGFITDAKVIERVEKWILSGAKNN